LLVGKVDASRIGQIGRTSSYDTDAYEKLVDLVSRFRSTVTTPHILAEASNLVVRGAHGPLAQELRTMLYAVSVATDERFVTARKLGKDTRAMPLGLADAAIIEAAARGCSVITDDGALCYEILRRGLSAINFNHVRFGEL